MHSLGSRPLRFVFVAGFATIWMSQTTWISWNGKHPGKHPSNDAIDVHKLPSICMQKWIKMFHATKYPSKLRGSSGSISILKDPAGGLLSGATKALIHCPQSCGNIHWWMLHPIRNCGLVNENVCAHTTMKSSIYTCFVVETESCQTNLHKIKRPKHPSRNEISSESKCWKVFPKVGFPVKKTGPNSTFHHAVRAWLSDPTQNAAEMNHEAKSKPKWLVEAVKMTMFPPNWFVFICMHREKCPVLWFGRVVVSPFGKNWIPKMFANLRE